MTDDDNRETTRRAVLTAAATTAAGSAGCLSVSTPADIAATTEIEGNVGYFVGSPWLADHRDSVVALDARPRRLFREERVYGARHVPLDEISAQADTAAGLIPDTDAIAETFAGLGVGHDDDVIVYGDSVGSRVTRTVFALQALGHRGEIQVLNGGFEAWTGRVGTGGKRSVSAAEYEPQRRSELWVTREWLADRVGTFNESGPGLVDVRVPEAYLGATGSDALDPAHDRHGHLPGATGVHWLGNVAGRRIDEPGGLFELYTGDAGLDPERTVVVYGDENVNPTQTWVTLRAIGFDDVRLYDGGFEEWANVADDRGRYPVETKTNAVVETEGGTGGTDGGDFSCTG
jgi:thiosulfate/3-mercaptopyruvate sulfurtransferase